MTEYQFRLTLIIPMNRRNLLRQFWREIIDFRGYQDTFTRGIVDREDRQQPTHFALSTAITRKLLLEVLKEMAEQFNIQFPSGEVTSQSIRQFTSQLPFICDVKRYNEDLNFNKLVKDAGLFIESDLPRNTPNRHIITP